ncbi:hypothetical protein RHODO2019_05015 [Rhodococcus antarcticus]|uniref:Uncharacterized protein n=1 Tax=Rhodococcus antarcticus TaxID=2987751 RepID=A0ABY6P2C9_9NOCA|nr:hypothetical protein [Rhodococcus antarcticus]UZJ25805.1 hypothetical protein RHODO2019_05015 [Rhodococcus antarcticus]
MIGGPWWVGLHGPPTTATGVCDHHRPGGATVHGGGLELPSARRSVLGPQD